MFCILFILFPGNCITEQCVWEKLASYKFDTELSSPIVLPTLYQERGSTVTGASLTGLRCENTRLSTIYQQICVGLISNIQTLLPLQQLTVTGINEIICTGSMFTSHPILKPIVRQIYNGMNVNFVDETNAAFGAVLMSRTHSV